MTAPLPPPAEPPGQVADASRRTHLAGERTQLAWWRTGLAAIAVALGVGRVVPELDPAATKWPYVVAGVGFALWGILAIAYGSAHRTTIDRAIAAGRSLPETTWPLQLLTAAGVGLGLLTALLIVLD